MITTAEEFFASAPVVDPLWTDLRNMIRHRYSNTPRHLQVALGPSEVGHPCMRKMAFGIMQVPRCNPEYDPLPSIQGTAMHTWLEGAARMDNERLGRERWLIETRVYVTPGLSGSADLFDVDTGTVIDWKNLGATSFSKNKTSPKRPYRRQIQLYGRGFRNAGYEVNRVAVAALPRSGRLRDMELKIEPYDDELASEILRTRDAVIGLLDDFDVDTDPNRYQWIPIDPDDCFFCPWWAAEPKTPLQCKGEK